MIDKVFIINGAPQSGKDTFIDLLSKSNRYNVIRTSIIDPIKEITSFLNFDTSKKTEKDRKLWADLMKATMDYNNYAITKTIEDVEKKDNFEYYSKKRFTIACIIVRNPENIEIFKEKFKEKNINTTTLFISNKEKEKYIPNNPEDKSIYDYTYDIYINNDKDIKQFEESIEFIDWENI